MTIYEAERLEKWIDNEVGFKCEESTNQQNTFSKMHTRFNITLSYNQQSITFDYQCNTTMTEPTKKDCLYCLLMDSSSYEYCENIDDFASEFGYEKVSECIEAFNGCKKNYQKLHKLFNNDEIEVLRCLFNDY